ncbi:MAG: MCE family protein [Streptosporangiales bacterium]|nr:MCE family protein [Streptosporangiales bacterium]
MIRRSVKLQLIAFLAITLLGVSYVGANYVGLTDQFSNRNYTITVELAEAGGIFENAEVTYRGVTVGKVEKVQLAEDGEGVRTTLRLQRDTPVPDDARAAVEERSAVGEQYIDLQPSRRGGPYLDEGSVIPKSRTRLPLSSTQLLLNLDKLVNSVDHDDLSTVITELDAAFADTGPALQSLIDNGNAFIGASTENIGPTTKLIEDGRIVLDTQLDSADSIRTFSKRLASFAEQFDESDPDLRRLIDNGRVSAPELSSLLRSIDPTIGTLLGNLVTIGGISAVRLPGFEQILVMYPDVVAGGFTVTADGTSHVGLVMQETPPPCTRGYESTKMRYPQQTSREHANHQARCKEPPSSKTNVRGVQNAPKPTGQEPRDPGRSGPKDGGTEAGMYRYDASTGQMTGPAGGPVRVSSAGGQQMFGDDSWKWLLLRPLGK